jgi:hypothetical protein
MDPAVLTWQIALAPRPRFSTGGRHWWREAVHDAWRAAHDAWLLDLEAASNGWATEAAEFRAVSPAPRLKDFMTHMSSGRWAPEPLGAQR